MTYITNGSRRADARLGHPPHRRRVRDVVRLGQPLAHRRHRRRGLEEAHLSQDWLLKGIQRFVDERDDRLARIDNALEMTRVS